MFTYNPWLGCHKVSLACQNCYVFSYNNPNYDQNNIIKNKNFDILTKKTRGHYVIRGGQDVIVCQKSDFFLAEADDWRADVYKMIKERKDLHFILQTKLIDRASLSLPDDWEDGYNNVTFLVSCEDQMTFDFRIPYLLNLKAKKKAIALTPLLDEIDITKLIKSNKDIEYINCGGENGSGARILNYLHVKKLSEDTLSLGIPFYFFDTGAYFLKDGKKYFIPYEKRYTQAYLSNLSHN